MPSGVSRAIKEKQKERREACAGTEEEGGSWKEEGFSSGS